MSWLIFQIIVVIVVFVLASALQPIVQDYVDRKDDEIRKRVIRELEAYKRSLEKK